MGAKCCKCSNGDANIKTGATSGASSGSSVYAPAKRAKGSRQLIGERYRIGENNNTVHLTLEGVTREDEGEYTVTAKNIAGESRSAVQLRIKDSSFDDDDTPNFLRRLNDLSVKVGTRTRFLVEIRSSSDIKVTWHRNDLPISENDRFHFLHEGNFFCVDVAPVTVEDGGRWTCMAENRAGRSSCSCRLNVLVPKAYKAPEFLEELKAVLTEQGTVSLECKVVGVPTPVLKWYKDGKEIKAGDVFALTANPDDPTSLGTYTCEAINCMGKSYSSSRVHVVGKGSREGSLRPADSPAPTGPPPHFVEELKNEKGKIGSAITLACQVTVPPWPRSITWYNKEGKIEPSEKYHIMEDGLGGYSIEIYPLEAIDEGEWKCVAASETGVIGITSCNVTVSYPKNYRKPKFLESLKAILTEEGLVSFECKVVGFPTPQLQWFKDGQELRPGDVYQLTGTNSLGTYSCIARNCMGEAKSTAELTVEDIQSQLNEEEKLMLFSKNQPPRFIRGLKSCEAKINEDFRFTIQVTVSPEPSLSWYRDDERIDNTERYTIIRENLGTCHLDIKKLEVCDQAEWKCVAANEFGQSVTSGFLKLTIPKHFKKPRFLECLRAILSEEGAVNLECKVIGVPQPVLKWYKDGKELKPGDIHKIISGQDGTCCLGTYTCEAYNCMGSASSSASLLGFEDRMAIKESAQYKTEAPYPLAKNISLSTIHEERTSQMYDTPVTERSITMDERGDVSFSFDGKEVSISLYETPDLTEDEALQVVEMYAEELSEHVSEQNVVELPPLRFTKESSKSGPLLMEAVVIDITPEYFASAEDDLRTEADFEDVSMSEEPTQNLASPEVEDEAYYEKINTDFLEKALATLSGKEPSPRKRSQERSTDSDKKDKSDSFQSLSPPKKESRKPSQDEDITMADEVLSGETFASAKGSSGVPREGTWEEEQLKKEAVLLKKKKSRSRSASVDNEKSHSFEEKVEEGVVTVTPKRKSVSRSSSVASVEKDKTKTKKKSVSRSNSGSVNQETVTGEVPETPKKKRISRSASGSIDKDEDGAAPKKKRVTRSASGSIDKEEEGTVQKKKRVSRSASGPIEDTTAEGATTTTKKKRISRSASGSIDKEKEQAEGVTTTVKKKKASLSPSGSVDKEETTTTKRVARKSLSQSSSIDKDGEGGEEKKKRKITRSVSGSIDKENKEESDKLVRSASASVIRKKRSSASPSSKTEMEKSQSADLKAEVETENALTKKKKLRSRSSSVDKPKLKSEKDDSGEKIGSETEVGARKRSSERLKKKRSQDSDEGKASQESVQEERRTKRSLSKEQKLEAKKVSKVSETKQEEAVARPEGSPIVLTTVTKSLQEIQKDLSSIEEQISREVESPRAKSNLAALDSLTQPIQEIQKGLKLIEQQVTLEQVMERPITPELSILETIARPIQDFEIGLKLVEEPQVQSTENLEVVSLVVSHLQTQLSEAKLKALKVSGSDELVGVLDILSKPVEDLLHALSEVKSAKAADESEKSKTDKAQLSVDLLRTLAQPVQDLQHAIEVAEEQAKLEEEGEPSTEKPCSIILSSLSDPMKNLKAAIAMIEQQALLEADDEESVSEKILERVSGPIEEINRGISFIEQHALMEETHELETSITNTEIFETLSHPIQDLHRGLAQIVQEVLFSTPKAKSLIDQETIPTLHSLALSTDELSKSLLNLENLTEDVKQKRLVFSPLVESLKGLHSSIAQIEHFVSCEPGKEPVLDTTWSTMVEILEPSLQEINDKLFNIEYELENVTEEIESEIRKEALVSIVKDLKKGIAMIRFEAESEATEKPVSTVLNAFLAPLRRLKSTLNIVEAGEKMHPLMKSSSTLSKSLEMIKQTSEDEKMAVDTTSLEEPKISLSVLRPLEKPLQDLEEGFSSVVQHVIEKENLDEVEKPAIERQLHALLEILSQSFEFFQEKWVRIESSKEPTTTLLEVNALLDLVRELKEGAATIEEQVVEFETISNKTSDMIKANVYSNLEKLQSSLVEVEDWIRKESLEIIPELKALNVTIDKIQENISTIQKEKSLPESSTELKILETISQPLAELHENLEKAKFEHESLDKSTLDEVVGKSIEAFKENLEKIEQTLRGETHLEEVVAIPNVVETFKELKHDIEEQTKKEITVESLAPITQSLEKFRAHVIEIQNETPSDSTAEFKSAELPKLDTLTEVIQLIERNVATIEEKQIFEGEMKEALSEPLVKLQAKLEEIKVSGSEMADQGSIVVLQNLVQPLNELQKGLETVGKEELESVKELPSTEVFTALATPIAEMQKGIATIQQQTALRLDDDGMPEHTHPKVLETLMQPFQELQTSLVQAQGHIERFAEKTEIKKETPQLAVLYDNLTKLEDTIKAETKEISSSKLGDLLQNLQEELTKGNKIENIDAISQALTKVEEEISQGGEQLKPEERKLIFKIQVEVDNCKQQLEDDEVKVTLTLKKKKQEEEAIQSIVKVVKELQSKVETSSEIFENTAGSLKILSTPLIQLEKALEAVEKDEEESTLSDITSIFENKTVATPLQEFSQCLAEIEHQITLETATLKEEDKDREKMLSVLAQPIADLRKNIAVLQQVTVPEESLGTVREQADLSVLKTLAEELQELQKAVTVVQEESVVESKDQLKAFESEIKEKEYAKVKTVGDREAAVGSYADVQEPQEDLSEKADISLLKTIAKPMQELEKILIQIKEHLTFETEEQSTTDKLHASVLETLAQPARELQSAVAVIEHQVALEASEEPQSEKSAASNLETLAHPIYELHRGLAEIQQQVVLLGENDIEQSYNREILETIAEPIEEMFREIAAIQEQTIIEPDVITSSDKIDVSLLKTLATPTEEVRKILAVIEQHEIMEPEVESWLSETEPSSVPTCIKPIQELHQGLVQVQQLILETGSVSDKECIPIIEAVAKPLHELERQIAVLETHQYVQDESEELKSSEDLEILRKIAAPIQELAASLAVIEQQIIEPGLKSMSDNDTLDAVRASMKSVSPLEKLTIEEQTVLEADASTSQVFDVEPMKATALAKSSTLTEVTAVQEGVVLQDEELRSLDDSFKMSEAYGKESLESARKTAVVEKQELLESGVASFVSSLSDRGDLEEEDYVRAQRQKGESIGDADMELSWTTEEAGSEREHVTVLEPNLLVGTEKLEALSMKPETAKIGKAGEALAVAVAEDADLLSTDETLVISEVEHAIPKEGLASPLGFAKVEGKEYLDYESAETLSEVESLSRHEEDFLQESEVLDHDFERLTEQNIKICELKEHKVEEESLEVQREKEGLKKKDTDAEEKELELKKKKEAEESKRKQEEEEKKKKEAEVEAKKKREEEAKNKKEVEAKKKQEEEKKKEEEEKEKKKREAEEAKRKQEEEEKKKVEVEIKKKQEEEEKKKKELEAKKKQEEEEKKKKELEAKKKQEEEEKRKKEEEEKKKKEAAEAKKKQEEEEKKKKEEIEAKKKQEEEEKKKKELEAKKKQEEEERKKNEEEEKKKKEAEEAKKKQEEEEKKKKELEAKKKREEEEKKQEEEEKKKKEEIEAKKKKEEEEKKKKELEAKKKQEEEQKKQKEEEEKKKKEAEEAKKKQEEEEKKKKELEAKKKQEEEEKKKKEAEEAKKKQEEEEEKKKKEAEAKRQEEEEKKKKELEAKKKQEEEEKKKKELEAKKKQEEEEKKKREAEEAKKKLEEEEKRKKELEAKKKQEEEERKKKEAEEAKKKQEEEEKNKKEETEAKKKQEEEEKKKKEEMAAKKKQEEEEKKKKAEEEKKKKEAEEAKKKQKEEENKKKEAEAKKKQEEEEKKKKDEIEAKKKQEEEERKKKEAEEAKKKQDEEEKKKKELEAKKKQEEEEEEEKKKKEAEEAKKKQEEVEKKKKELEAKKKQEEEEKKKKELEAKKKQEEEEKKKKQEEEERKKKEAEEAKKKQEEEEKKRKEEIEAKKKQEEEEKKKKELEAKKKQEEEEKKKKEEEEKKKKEAEEAKKKQEEEEKKKKEAEAKRQEEEEKEKKKKEAEEAKRKEEEEERKKKEAEAKKKQEEEEKKKKEELEAKIKLEEEEKKKKEEIEAKKKQEEEEKKKKELEAKKKQEEEKKKKEEEEKKKNEAEEAKKKQEEEEKKKKEELEAKKKQEEEEKKKKAEEEKKKKEAEEAKKKQEDEEKKKKEEIEAKKKQEEEKKKKKELEAKKKQEEEEKKKNEEEEKKKKEAEEAKKKQEEEEKKKKEELEAKKKQEEEEKKKKAEEEKKKKEAEEAKKKQEEEENKKKEAEAKKKQEEEEKKKKDEIEAKKKQEEEVKKKKEEDEAKKKQEEEERKKKEAEEAKKKQDEEKKKKEAEEAKIKQNEEEAKKKKEEEVKKKQEEDEKKKKKSGSKKKKDEEEKKIKETEETKKNEEKEKKEKEIAVDIKEVKKKEIFAEKQAEETYERKEFIREEEQKTDYRKIKTEEETLSEEKTRKDVPLPVERSDRKRASSAEYAAVPSKLDTLLQRRMEETKEEVAERRQRSQKPGPDSKKKPYFCTRLTDRTAAQGSHIKLTCTILGCPEPSLQWLRNGTPLIIKPGDPATNRFHTKVQDGLASLEIDNATPGDSGEYTCLAKNIHGETNTSCFLKVYAGFEPAPFPPTFTRPIKDTYKYSDDELTLQCRVRSQPPPKITWLKDGVPIKPGSRYQQSELADGLCKLVIFGPETSDSGEYMCRAENEVASDHSSCSVNFLGRQHYAEQRRTEERRSASRARDFRKPHFATELTDHIVPAGGTLALQVEVKGAPRPEVKWIRGTEELPRATSRIRSFEDSGVYTLLVANASEKEAGLYTCHAYNAFGYVDTTASVEVIPAGSIRGGKPPTIINRPADLMRISVEDDLILTCRVTGEPKPRVTWLKGTKDITITQRTMVDHSDDYYRFTLKKTVPADAGTYWIVAKNAYGCDRAFITVQIKQRARSLTPGGFASSRWDFDSSITSELLSDIHEREKYKKKETPGPITSEPFVADSGRNWLTLSWSKPSNRGAAPVIAYRVDAWEIGQDGGARWAELGISPVNTFDAFNLKPGAEYKFRITPRNRYGWGEPLVTSQPICVGYKAINMPEFTKLLPGQLKALLGATIRLECQVTSDVPPEITWYRDGFPIDFRCERFSSKFDGKNCHLIIEDLKEEDSGRFMCEAVNKIGRVSTFARLMVVSDPKIWAADTNLKRGMYEEDGVTLDSPPQFAMRLRDRRVQVTYPVRLTCQVFGFPYPEVTWFRDGTELVQDERYTFWNEEHFHTLEITKTILDDSGCYTAAARNEHGSVSCRCNLVVDKGIRAYVAPEFITELEVARSVKLGGELRLTAQVEAYPSVGVVWHRNSIRLRPSRRIVMTLDHDGAIELAIAGVTERDGGIYTCTATNEVGRCETTCRVSILPGSSTLSPSIPTIQDPQLPYSKAPSFITKPRSSEAVEGDTVIIDCEVIGDPKPEVFWLRDFLKPDYYRDSPHFRREGEGPCYRLEIPHAKLDYTGTYSVIARNVHGEAKAVISLQIYAKGQGKEDRMDHSPVTHGKIETLPTFKKGLKDIRCCDGDAVTLECVVSAAIPPEIRWERGGKLVRLGGDFEADFDGETASLTIHQVYPEDEGEYTCVAYNDLGRASTSACLVVDVPEEKENLLSRQLNRPPGLLSNCSTPRSTPRTTPSRSISPYCPRPSYRESSCVRTKRLKVTSPKFYAVPHNRIAEEGETVRFQCAVAGHPTPWVSWDKNGSPVTPTSRITITEKDDLKILEISEVTVEDAGLYRVTLENEIGRIEATARLDVIGPHGYKTKIGNVRAWSASPRSSPTFRRRLVGSIGRAGGNITLACDVKSSPNPVTSWYRNGDLIVKTSRTFPTWDGHTAMLEIENLELEDAGIYTCVAENEIGKTHCSAELVVLPAEDESFADKMPPSFLEGLNDLVAQEGNPVELQVKVEGTGPLDVVWVKDNVIIPDCEDFRYVDYGDGRLGLRLADAFPQDSGEYICEVFNQHGDAITSARLWIKENVTNSAPKIAFSKKPTSAVVACGQSVSFCSRLQQQTDRPRTIISWFLGDQIISKSLSNKYHIEEDGDVSIFHISPVERKDAGQITCKARYVCSLCEGKENPKEKCCCRESEVSCSAELTVLPANSRDNWSSDSECENFKCRKIRSRSLSNSEIVEDLPKMLRDCASYSVAKDGENCNGTRALLIRGPADVNVFRGDRVILSATYCGQPEPNVRWLKGGQEIKTGERINIITGDGMTSLTFDSINADDSGKYVVSVENVYGADCHFASVAVEGPPDPPSGQPTATPSGTDSAEVAWSSPAFDGGCKITGYVLEMKNLKDNEWKKISEACHSLSFLVKDLQPQEKYIFRVRAENVHGQSEPSLESNEITIPENEIGNELAPQFEPRLVTIEPGEKFKSKYDVLEELGKGRYGVVHKVTDLETGQKLAAKFIRCIKLKDREKVKEEIEIMNCLRHPKLLQLAAAFESPREIVMVMEYISGGELFERVVADDFQLTERDCILFMRQICEGVEYMHKNNVVHLDLKPENIMCQTRTSHEIKLIDFGLAQKLDPNTPVRVLFGTPEFVPPEIINYEPIGVESDMWSVGVICYVLLSGLSPFMGENDAETFANITRASYDFDDEAFDAISQDAKDFISSLLVKRKEKRLTASECLHNKWMMSEHDKTMGVILSTDKLKKFIIRRKWQKTGNAIRALGRMATLSAASRRNSGASSTSSTGSPRPSLSVSRMSSINQEEGEQSPSMDACGNNSSPITTHHRFCFNTNKCLDNNKIIDKNRTFGKIDENSENEIVSFRDNFVGANGCDDKNRTRICSERSDSGISDCSSIGSSSSHGHLCQCTINSTPLLNKKYSITEDVESSFCDENLKKIYKTEIEPEKEPEKVIGFETETKTSTKINDETMGTKVDNIRKKFANLSRNIDEMDKKLENVGKKLVDIGPGKLTNAKKTEIKRVPSLKDSKASETKKSHLMQPTASSQAKITTPKSPILQRPVRKSLGLTIPVSPELRTAKLSTQRSSLPPLNGGVKNNSPCVSSTVKGKSGGSLKSQTSVDSGVGGETVSTFKTTSTKRADFAKLQSIYNAKTVSHPSNRSVVKDSATKSTSSTSSCSKKNKDLANPVSENLKNTQSGNSNFQKTVAFWNK